MNKQVLSVGQCGVDQASIRHMLQSHFEVEIHAANTETEAWMLIQQHLFDLILVNRIFDWDGTPGLPLVERIKSEPSTSSIPVMLVSNFADAQQQAKKAGAETGFGKAELHHPETINRLAEYLEQSAE